MSDVNNIIKIRGKLKRKIIQSGSARVVTIPNPWLREHNLELGSYVEITLTDDSMIVRRWEE